MNTEYQTQPVRDGRLTKPHHTLSVGQFVLINSGVINVAKGHWNTPASGPYLILESDEQSVKVKNLALGRVSYQNKANCVPLRMTVGLESSGGGE